MKNLMKPRLRGCSLGRALRIGSKAYGSIMAPGYKKEFYQDTYEFLIGIGKNNYATLLMSKDAYNALNKGEEVTICTIQQVKKSLK